MIVILSVMTALALPMILVFSHGEGFNFGYKSGIEVYSLGNFGYSSVQCENIPIGLGLITLQC